MTMLSLQDAQAQLAELIHRLRPGDAITITENDTPVARLVGLPAMSRRPTRPRPPVTGIPKAGRWQGQLVVPPDFDEPLEELREYME
jgi:prevent-host-death family protein